MTEDVAAMLRESAREFTRREQDPRALRARMGAAPGYDTAHFAQLHELGWRAALVREELGGAGLGLREVAAVAEELGRGLLGDQYVATAVFPVRLLQDRATQAPAAALLQEVAAGRSALAVAWQEHPDALAEDAIETVAHREGAGYVLDGRKGWVAGAAAADGLLLSARLDDGMAVFHVRRDAPGLSQATSWQADGTAAIELGIEGVALGADALLLAPADGAAALARALDATAVTASAELLGLAGAAFDQTLAYLRTRVQFDKAIGSFQALQHKAVDLLVQRELAAAVLEEALAAFDAEAGTERDRRRLASRCKARCSDMALRVTRECIQLHGAIGYTHECGIGLYLKRALVLAAWLGNGTRHRRRWSALAASAGPG